MLTQPTALFGYDHLQRVALAARGLTPRHSTAERGAAFETFMREDIRFGAYNEHEGVAYSTIIYRRPEGGMALDVESTDPESCHERHDLDDDAAAEFIGEAWRASNLAFRHSQRWQVQSVTRFAFEVPGSLKPEPNSVVIPASIVAPLSGNAYTSEMLAERWNVKLQEVRSFIDSGELEILIVGRRTVRMKSESVEAFELARGSTPGVLGGLGRSPLPAAPAAVSAPIVAAEPVSPRVFPPLTRPAYSVQDLGERWGFRDLVVRQLIKTGTIDGFRVGRKSWMVGADAVRAFETSGYAAAGERVGKLGRPKGARNRP